jgi:hypothetical protein
MKNILFVLALLTSFVAHAGLEDTVCTQDFSKSCFDKYTNEVKKGIDDYIFKSCAKAVKAEGTFESPSREFDASVAECRLKSYVNLIK